MKTPIQELIEYLLNYYNVFGLNEEPWLAKEKCFAEECFIAGAEGREIPEEEKPELGYVWNFNDFYKQWE